MANGRAGQVAGIELRQVSKGYGDARSPLVVQGIDLVVP